MSTLQRFGLKNCGFSDNLAPVLCLYNLGPGCPLSLSASGYFLCLNLHYLILYGLKTVKFQVNSDYL